MEWDFALKDAQDQILSRVNKNWTGFGRELFTDGNQYIVHLEEAIAVRQLSVLERAMVLGTAVTIDNDYFSRHSGGGMFSPPIILPWGGSSSTEAPAGGESASTEDAPIAGAGAGAAGAGAGAGGWNKDDDWNVGAEKPTDSVWNSGGSSSSPKNKWGDDDDDGGSGWFGGGGDGDGGDDGDGGFLGSAWGAVKGLLGDDE